VGWGGSKLDYLSPYLPRFRSSLASIQHPAKLTSLAKTSTKSKFSNNGCWSFVHTQVQLCSIATWFGNELRQLKVSSIAVPSSFPFFLVVFLSSPFPFVSTGYNNSLPPTATFFSSSFSFYGMHNCHPSLLLPPFFSINAVELCSSPSSTGSNNSCSSLRDKT
jgi:hypothetical protein